MSAVSAPTRRRVDRVALPEVAPLLGVVAVLHVVGFGVVAAFVVPAGVRVGDQVFGFGLAVTAYLFGLRHAFDPDHIAAIDNTTRALTRREGRRPRSIGLWFSLGHSTVVCVMAALVAVGAGIVGRLVSEDSTEHALLGTIGTTVSGVFLLLIGLINLVALVGILQAFSAMRSGEYDDDALEGVLHSRGVFARILAPLLARVARPWHIYPIGVLFGLGFDTATEISLLVLAGTGSAAGVPWYAVMALPVVFAAGMSLMDTLDGIFMGAAYDWAFARPARKIYYNLTVTALSVVVALVIGGIEIVQVLHERGGLDGPWVARVADLQLDHVGYLMVGLFVVAWLGSVAVWRLGRLDERWAGPGTTDRPDGGQRHEVP